MLVNKIHTQDCCPAVIIALEIPLLMIWDVTAGQLMY
jgi:hypothetical protein